jgi:zinc transport system permease protein
MDILEGLYALAARLPFDCMQARFMQQALLALLLLSPMTAFLGVQVVNFRMAFFSDAISHSTFAGVALGVILALDPSWTMPAFGVLVGCGIVAVKRHSLLSADTVIGVFFAGVMASGLAVISREPGMARNVQMFLYGDILSIGDPDIVRLSGLCAVLGVFQTIACNRLLYIGLNPALARAHGIRAGLWQYAFAALLALTVMFSVQAVGMFLVTAMLIVPAAAARNLAGTGGGMFWWALAVSLISSVAGLILSAQEWAHTATGATIVLIACLCFLLSRFAFALAGKREVSEAD